MNRKEIAVLFKEIFDNCPNLEGKPFALMPPNADDVLSKDYQVHILTEVEDSLLVCIRRIIKKHGNLALSEQKNLLVIYEPIKKDVAATELANLTKNT
jgi:hypothetical protein